MKKAFLALLFSFALISFAYPRFSLAAPSVSLIGTTPSSVRVFEKYEIKFNVNTVSAYPFLQYDSAPPSGVQPGIGVTVEGRFTKRFGNQATLKQPAFYMTQVNRTGAGSSMVFEETNQKYWALRFSPQEQGEYEVAIYVKDTGGETTFGVGRFTATAPVKKGFIQVSQADPRYFEFTSGEIYWPIGPVWSVNHSANPGSSSYNYAQYKDTGQNLERTWMGGLGIYSTNWARWRSSSEKHGNEGVMTRLNWREHYPGHDLSYEIFYPQGADPTQTDPTKEPNGYRIWLTTYGDDMFGPRLEAGARYQVKLVLKTQNIAGPRNSSYPYGFIVRTHTPDMMWNPTSPNQFDDALRNAQKIIPNHINASQDWQTLTATFIPTANRDNIYLYLDNVTKGEVYIDEFSLKEIDGSGNIIGGEKIRNPRADEHLFAEQRPAAYIDWQVEQGEQNGVFFKYVVHDKNDWIQNHLLTSGQFADDGNGYYQDENTKARWLVRQWYRYLIARWGYSTAIHSWELNNEGPPNSDPPGSNTAPHWRTAQAFAKFMHDFDPLRHLATTSFWCCWRPAFWGNLNATFPDIDYADLHEYTGNPQTADSGFDYDMAGWLEQISQTVFTDQVGKPTLLGEAGISNPNGWDSNSELQKPNPGIWYHNLLWTGLHQGSVSAPNYWFAEHFRYINREEISKPFYDFVKTLDVNKGGYGNLQATATNAKLRVFGQKNSSQGKAYLWIQNKDHTWKNVMDNPGGNYQLSGNVSLIMKPNTSYQIAWWDTFQGTVAKQEQKMTDSAGNLSLSLSGFDKDIAAKILGEGTGCPKGPQGDANCDNLINIADLLLLLNNWNSSTYSAGDFNASGRVDVADLLILLNHWGG